MSEEVVASDSAILDLLRSEGQQTVAQLAEATEVTATAVRQRLNRLMGDGLVRRFSHKAGRGRPSHCYALTDKGLRNTGANFFDLATVMWEEILAIENPEFKARLVESLVSRLSAQYGRQMHGKTLEERMKALAEIFGERKIPVRVATGQELPILEIHACPYPGLAEKDRTICELEKGMVSQLLGSEVELDGCRLDGAGCCSFTRT